GALGGVRDLVDVEVELLGPGRVGVVEGLVGPVHLAAGEAQLPGNGIRHRALVALAVRRVVALEPGRVGRLVGGNGQRAPGVQLTLDGRIGAAGRGRARSAAG